MGTLAGTGHSRMTVSSNTLLSSPGGDDAIFLFTRLLICFFCPMASSSLVPGPVYSYVQLSYLFTKYTIVVSMYFPYPYKIPLYTHICIHIHIHVCVCVSVSALSKCSGGASSLDRESGHVLAMWSGSDQAAEEDPAIPREEPGKPSPCHRQTCHVLCH